jgi:sugar phosphate isomerase/epimerase
MAAWNPMEAMMAREHPVDGIDALAGRIGLVRCSNGIQVGNGWEPRTIDRGAIEWADQIDRLRRMSFDGPVSLEIRVDPGPKSGLRESMALIDLLRTVR